MAPEIESFLAHCATRVNDDIGNQLRKYPISDLTEAIRYASTGEGKRIRPALVYATARTIGLDFARVDAVACAIELIHCYSLIHDDLPAMDDDDLRRGKPSCHKAFGEAVAILAGDAMQALAFERLARDRHLHAAQKVEVIGILANTAGPAGMASGQALDVAATGSLPETDHLERIHRLKTGTLMAACVTMTLACGDAPQAVGDGLRAYAEDIGLCFQIRDDLIDVDTATATLGKRRGSDQRKDKPTYASVLGVEGARRAAAALGARCLRRIEKAGAGADTLRRLTRHVAERDF